MALSCWAAPHQYHHSRTWGSQQSKIVSCPSCKDWIFLISCLAWEFHLYHPHPRPLSWRIGLTSSRWTGSKPATLDWFTCFRMAVLRGQSQGVSVVIRLIIVLIFIQYSVKSRSYSFFSHQRSCFFFSTWVGHLWRPGYQLLPIVIEYHSGWVEWRYKLYFGLIPVWLLART